MPIRSAAARTVNSDISARPPQSTRIISRTQNEPGRDSAPTERAVLPLGERLTEWMGPVGLFEPTDLLVRKLERERRRRVLEMVWLGRADDRRSDRRLV